MHTTGFPNLFIMGGYQASFQFNLTDMLQTQGDHIAACIDHVRSNGFRTIDPRYEAEEWWVQEVIKHRGKTSRSEECTPGDYTIWRVLISDAKMETIMAASANILNTKVKCEKDLRNALIWKNAKHNLKEYDYEPS